MIWVILASAGEDRASGEGTDTGREKGKWGVYYQRPGEQGPGMSQGWRSSGKGGEWRGD